MLVMCFVVVGGGFLVLFLVISVVKVRLLVMFSVVWYMFRKWFMLRIRLMFSGLIFIIV